MSTRNDATDAIARLMDAWSECVWALADCSEDERDEALADLLATGAADAVVRLLAQDVDDYRKDQDQNEEDGE